MMIQVDDDAEENQPFKNDMENEMDDDTIDDEIQESWNNAFQKIVESAEIRQDADEKRTAKQSEVNHRNSDKHRVLQGAERQKQNGEPVFIEAIQLDCSCIQFSSQAE